MFLLLTLLGLRGLTEMSKIKDLAEIEGFDSVDDMLINVGLDSVVPGICKTPDCDYVTEVEPDSRSGWCANCEKQTVVSALELYGF